MDEIRDQLRPTVDEVTRFFWDGAAGGELLIQRCGDCETYIHWPLLSCPACGSARVEPARVTGRGEVFSFTIVHQPYWSTSAQPVPYNLAIVELEEQANLRLITNIRGCADRDIYVGMKVRVGFEQRDGYALPVFTPDTESPAPAG